MPWVRRKAVVEAFVWEPFERPQLPSRPDWRPETGLPGFPDIGLPGEPDRPWEPGFPGGGPVLPGRPTVPPGWERPELPELPSIPVYEIVDADDIGGHDDLPDLNATRQIVVTDGTNRWPAYVVVSGDSEEPRRPSKGLPGQWVTVGFHGAIAWAWSPTLEMPSLPERPERPGQGLPGRPNRPGGRPEE